MLTKMLTQNFLSHKKFPYCANSGAMKERLSKLERGTNSWAAMLSSAQIPYTPKQLNMSCVKFDSKSRTGDWLRCSKSVWYASIESSIQKLISETA